MQVYAAETLKDILRIFRETDDIFLTKFTRNQAYKASVPVKRHEPFIEIYFFIQNHDLQCFRRPFMYKCVQVLQKITLIYNSPPHSPFLEAPVFNDLRYKNKYFVKAKYLPFLLLHFKLYLNISFNFRVLNLLLKSGRKCANNWQYSVQEMAELMG